MAESHFKVIGYTGTPRSGKGTIVNFLAASHEGVAVEEAGADYRALTRILLDSHRLESSMPPYKVAREVGRLDVGLIADIVANRRTIVEEHGIDSLYKPDVEELVAVVGAVATVQEAVNMGFKERVEKVIEKGESDVLLLDHRNAVPIISAIPAARLVMRTFVSCLSFEAARRECERLEVLPGKGNEMIMKTRQTIEEREKADAERKVDPVVPDRNAIDYWYDSDIFEGTVRIIAPEQLFNDSWTVATSSFESGREYTDKIRYGVGTKAVETGRQVRFDTTPFRSYNDPVAGMLKAANVMFEEALASVGSSTVR